MKTTLAQAIEQGATIRKLVANPYREGSKAWTQFESYQNGRSVEATLAAVAKLTDAIASAERFRWDLNHDTVALDIPASKKAKAEPKAEVTAEAEATPAKAKRSRKAKEEPKAEAEPEVKAEEPKAEEPKAEPTPKAKRSRKAKVADNVVEFGGKAEPTPKAEEPKAKAKRSRSKASHSSLEPAFPAPTPAGA